jgi:virginiamycin B lyase
MRWLVGVPLALVCAAPAHAGIVAEAELGSSLDDLVVGADGGAWVFITRPDVNAVGRMGLDGHFRTAATREPTQGAFGPIGGVLGPDGNAWFQTGPARFLRADGADTLASVADAADDEELGTVAAVGPDGTLWSPTRRHDGFWHMAPDGRRVRVPAQLPRPCDRRRGFADMAIAAEGAVWLADPLCKRLVRAGAGPAMTIGLETEPVHLAADPAGGVWASGTVDAAVAHVNAAGHVTAFDVPPEIVSTQDVAAASDGSGWFAAPDCRLLRVSPAGEMTVSRSPIHVDQLAFDPADGLWVRSEGRLAHLVPGESVSRCDRRAPALRVSPRGTSISLRRLRRGFTITVREPALVAAGAVFRDRPEADGRSGASLFRIVRAAHGQTLHYRIPARRLRHWRRLLAAGGKPSIVFAATASDLENNITDRLRTVRVRP